MTNEFRQLQKNEALMRLEILQSKYGLPEYVAREFAESENKYYSEHIIYKNEWKIKKISQDDYFENAVKEFEKNNNALVYYAIFETSARNGLEIDMLYVSDEKWDWSKDKDELTNGEPLVYSKNFDYDDRTGEFYVSLARISFKEG